MSEQATARVEATHAYCPACSEESAIDREGRCLWCGGRTRRKIRNGGKPAGVYGKLTDDHLRALHVAHMQGTSMRELGRRVYERMGYASAKSATGAMQKGWQRLNLPTRDRLDAIRLSNVERATPGSPGTADRSTYKKWLRRKAGAQRPCRGVRLSHPRKGEPCQRWAMHGSDYCLQHDPDRRAEVVARVEAAREAAPNQPKGERVSA